jgi:glucosamine-phosphate N-acetyltransferase
MASSNNENEASNGTESRCHDEAEMFPAELLTKVTPSDLPEGFSLRPLRIFDYDNGYLQLLAQLTSVGEVSRKEFQQRFASMSNAQPRAYFVVVIEETSSARLVASGTLVIEWKFIHKAGSRGRVEDIVVDSSVRGRQLGTYLNRTLVSLAKELGVYKLSLECRNALIPFYEQFGYALPADNNFLVQRFDGKEP